MAVPIDHYPLKTKMQALKRMYLCLAAIFIAMVFAIAPQQPALSEFEPCRTDPTELGRVVEEIEYLDAMRSTLAASLEDNAEESTTMQEVCQPVGQKAKLLSEKNGWQVKQIAKKYRNPNHAPVRLQDWAALARFEQNPNLGGFWERETIGDRRGTRYFRRINVEASCLACHGLKHRRPQFVKDNYPQDLTYDFKVGDLRGMYSAFMPDIKGVLQDVLPNSNICDSKVGRTPKDVAMLDKG